MGKLKPHSTWPLKPAPNYTNAFIQIYTDLHICTRTYDDVIKWKHFPRYWSFVREIHRSPLNSAHKSQWGGFLMFSLICALNKHLSKHSWGWWFKTPSRSLWRHCNECISWECVWDMNPSYGIYMHAKHAWAYNTYTCTYMHIIYLCTYMNRNVNRIHVHTHIHAYWRIYVHVCNDLYNSCIILLLWFKHFTLRCCKEIKDGH